MKKILVITPHTPSLVWFRLDMMNAFQNRGYEVVAVGEEDERIWQKRFAEYHIRYCKIPIERNGLNLFRDIRTLRAMEALLKDEQPEKVFLYQAKAVVYGSIASSRVKGIEVYNLISGLGSIFRGTGLKKSVLRFLMKIQYRYALRKSMVIFHNHDDMQQFVDWRIVKSSQCDVVHGSGVNLEKFEYCPIPENEVIFLMVSRLIRDKGIMEYLNACHIVKKKYPEVRCLLVGAYDTNPSAIQPEEISKYFESDVEYVGQQKDVVPFLQMCTTFVLPSYHEGTPKSVLEAMAVGRPIITTMAPGCRETVEDGRNGYLVPTKDADMLAKKMIYLIENPDIRRKMSVESRKIVQDKYDVNKVNQEILKIMKMNEE